jgi:hypothetical protein
MRHKRIALFLGMLLMLATGGAAMAQVYTCTVTVNEDWSWTQHCVPVATPAPTVAPATPTETPTFTPTETPIAPTSTPEPVATNTVSPPTPTPTPTQDHSGHDEALYWHAPAAHMVAGIMATVHEHGDAPPDWVLGYNRTAGIGEAGTGRPAYEHVAGTPNENGHDAGAWWKHTAFKGWAGRFQNVDWYGIFHLDFNPSGHPSRFHSYQMWLRDGTGAVSYMHGWLDFGVGNSTGPQVVVTCGNDSGIRPIMKVNSNTCPANQITFENWYDNNGGAWGLDFGFNINANYRAGGDPANPASWSAIGLKNLTRRIEFAWYPERSSQRGEFWADQFGRTMSGPNDARCGTQQAVGTRSYTVVCLKQYIAPSLTAIRFPGNAIQRVFDGAGVQLPN